MDALKTGEARYVIDLGPLDIDDVRLLRGALVMVDIIDGPRSPERRALMQTIDYRLALAEKNRTES